MEQKKIFNGNKKSIQENIKNKKLRLEKEAGQEMQIEQVNNKNDIQKAEEENKNNIESEHKKKEWNPKNKIIHLSRPEKIQEEDSQKKYKVFFQYIDFQNVKHNKTIRFGEKNYRDYVDDKDLQIRAINCAKLRNITNPLHKNFWRINILNNLPTIEESYNALLKNYLFL